VDVKTTVYITDAMDPTFRFILGMPFIKASKCSMENLDDNTCLVGLYDREKNRRVKLVAENNSVLANEGLVDMVQLTRVGGTASHLRSALNERASTRN
jgi:hypothetical protein